MRSIYRETAHVADNVRDTSEATEYSGTVATQTLVVLGYTSDAQVIENKIEPIDRFFMYEKPA